jgi:hypothetical protein
MVFKVTSSKPNVFQVPNHLYPGSDNMVADLDKSMKEINTTREMNNTTVSKFDKLSLSSSIINGSFNVSLIKMFIKVLRNANINQHTIINILKNNDSDKNIINKLKELVKYPINSYNEKCESTQGLKNSN